MPCTTVTTSSCWDSSRPRTLEKTGRENRKRKQEEKTGREKGKRRRQEGKKE
jgi:hypothetical protein